MQALCTNRGISKRPDCAPSVRRVRLPAGIASKLQKAYEEGPLPLVDGAVKKARRFSRVFSSRISFLGRPRLPVFIFTEGGCDGLLVVEDISCDFAPALVAREASDVVD